MDITLNFVRYQIYRVKVRHLFLRLGVILPQPEITALARQAMNKTKEVKNDI